MKKLFLLFFVLESLQVFAQAPANDLCINAENLTLTMNLNPIITTPGNCYGATATLGIPLSDTVCGTWKSNRRDVWFKFNATSSKGGFWFKGELSGFRYQLFSGNCNGMNQIFCRAFNIPACCIDSVNYSTFIRDSTYYIRVYNFENMNQVNLNFKIGMLFFDSAIVKSKVLGGDWQQASTWEGNQVPTINDSVHIVEGSRVFASFSIANAKWLKVGGDDTLKKAILNIASLNVEKGILLTKGDSIVSRNSNGMLSNGAIITTSGNMRINGGINIKRLGLYFLGSSPIVVDGSGAIILKTISPLFNSNPNVQMHFGGTIENKIFLNEGHIHFHKPMLFDLRYPIPNSVSEGQNSVLKFNGTYSGLFSYKIPNDFLQEKGYITYSYRGEDSKKGAIVYF